MPEIETGQINLTYPITFDPATFQQYNLPAYFGGFQVNEIMMALIRVNFGETSFLSCLSTNFIITIATIAFINIIIIRFLTLALWRRLKPYPSPISWTSLKNGRYKYTNTLIKIQIDYKYK